MNIFDLIEEEFNDLQNEEMFSSTTDDQSLEVQEKNQAFLGLISALDNVLVQCEQIEPKSLSETDKNLLYNYVFKGFMPAFRKIMRGGVMEFDQFKEKLNALIREAFEEMENEDKK